MKTINILIIIGFLLSLLLYLLIGSFRTDYYIITLLLFSVYFFGFGFFHFNEIKISNIFKKSSYKSITISRLFISVFSGFFISFMIISFMFRLFSWPGTSVMIIYSSIHAVFMIIILSILYIKTKGIFYLRTLLSFLIYCLILSILFFNSNFLKEIKNRNIQKHTDSIENYE